MRSVLVISLMATLVACGGGGDDGQPPPQVASVTVAGQGSGNLTALAATRSFTATALDANQDVVGNANVTWSASPAGIVTLSPTTGLTTTATAVANGTATITASSGSITGSAPLTVAQSFNSVLLVPSPGTVLVGQTLQLTASGRDPGGSKINSVSGFTFTSDDQNVATVSSTGLVSGVALGSANITAEATSGSTTRSIASAVTVTNQTFPATAEITGLVNPIAFSPPTVDISAGGTVTFHFLSLGHTVVFASQAGAPSDIPVTSNDDVDRTFSQAGTFNFECIIHPGMSGTVIVH